MQCNMCHPDGELKIVLRFDLIACTEGRRRFHHVFLFFPFLLPLHVEGFQFLDQHYCLAAPPPTGRRAPPIPAALPKNKRESVRRHPLDLFHAPAPTPLPDGAAFFFRVSLNPKSPPKWMCPSPSPHSSAARHPPALSATRPCPEHAPFPVPPSQPAPFKSLTTCLLWPCSRTLLFAAVNLLFLICSPPRPAEEGKTIMFACETVCNEAVLLNSTESTFDFKWQPKTTLKHSTKIKQKSCHEMHYYHEYWPNKILLLNTVFAHAMKINGGQVIMAKITSLCCLFLQYI